MMDTNQAIFDEGLKFADSISKKTGLPIICNTVQREMFDTGMIMTTNVIETYPVDIYVKTVWQNAKFDNKIGSV